MEVLELGVPDDPAAARVEGVEVELAVPVGTEEDPVADPGRIRVVRAALGLGDRLHRMVRGVVDPDAGRRAAAVVLPLLEALRRRDVGDAAAVGRVAGAQPVRDRQLRGQPAGQRHGEELEVAVREHAALGSEQHGRAVDGEALDQIGARVPGEPLRLAAGGRHDEDVDVAVVLGAERDERAVG